MTFFSTVIDLIVPPVCLGCNRFGYQICDRCLTEVASHPYPYRVQWRDPMLKTSFTKQLYPLAGRVTLFRFKDRLQTIIHQIKYQSYYAHWDPVLELVKKELGGLRASGWRQFLKTQPIIIPIPLHWRRKSQRGFNQAEYIAKGLQGYYQLPISNQFIQRAHYTKPQAELNKQQRLLNMQNAFKGHPSLKALGDKPLIGKTCLLVDDVWTTGATMKAAATTLLDYGATAVWGFSLAG